MYGYYPVSLEFRNNALSTEIGCNLADGFDIWKTLYRSYILVCQVINQVEIILQAISDQTAGFVFVKDLSRGVMRIIDHHSTSLRPGRIVLAELFHLSNNGVYIQTQGCR